MFASSEKLGNWRGQKFTPPAKGLYKWDKTMGMVISDKFYPASSKCII